MSKYKIKSAQVTDEVVRIFEENIIKCFLKTSIMMLFNITGR